MHAKCLVSRFLRISSTNLQLARHSNWKRNLPHIFVAERKVWRDRSRTRIPRRSGECFIVTGHQKRIYLHQKKRGIISGHGMRKLFHKTGVLELFHILAYYTEMTQKALSCIVS